MKNAGVVVAFLMLVGIGGCVAPGTAEDFKWSVEVPKTVDKGTEFNLKVVAAKSVEPAAEGAPTAKEIEGMPFHYQIHWTGGSPAPLRHKGWTGEAVKIRARMVPGPAAVLITSLNKEGLDVKVAEATVEVMK